MTPVQRSAVLVGAPFDNASSFLQGPSEAPPVIRDALYSPAGNLYSEDGTDLAADGLLRDIKAIAEELDIERPSEASRQRLKDWIWQVEDLTGPLTPDDGP